MAPAVDDGNAVEHCNEDEDELIAYTVDGESPTSKPTTAVDATGLIEKLVEVMRLQS